MFVQIVRLVREMGLVKLGTVAIDGTEVKTDASRLKAMSYESMQQAEAELKVQIDALLERPRSTDEAEADKPDLDITTEIAAPRACRRSSRRAGAWRNANAMSTSSAGAARTTTASRTKATATPPANASSENLACPIRRRKTTSPTPTAAS